MVLLSFVSQCGQVGEYLVSGADAVLSIKLLRAFELGKRGFIHGDMFWLSHLSSMIILLCSFMELLMELFGLRGKRVEVAVMLFFAAWSASSLPIILCPLCAGT